MEPDRKPKKNLKENPKEKSVSLADMFPQPVSFTLKSTGKEYQFRIMDLDDRSWMNEKYGNLEILKSLSPRQMGEIGFRLLADKNDFLASKEEDIDDDGVCKKRLITGPEKFRKAVIGIDEMTMVIKKLMKAFGLSQGMLDRIELKAEEVEKKMLELNDGTKSPTSSSANTDGESTNSKS